MDNAQALTALLAVTPVKSAQLPLCSAPLFVAELLPGSPDMAIVINADDDGRPDTTDPGEPVRVESLGWYLTD